jgi:glycosyltransferase involved in cell wall biosynthesis
MRIAITADPEIPVPPQTYGGIERIIAMLVEGLLARGHDITLFAHPDSNMACRQIPWHGQNSRSRYETVMNSGILAREILGGGYDLIHSFSRIAYLLPMLPMTIPKIMTYQREISPRSIRNGVRLSRGSLHFTAISQHMIEPVRDLTTWRIIANGVTLAKYDYHEQVDTTKGPLLFLGRVEHIKGVHLAIEVARRSGRKLIIAGNIPAGHESFFEQRIQPQLGNGIEYVGPVDDRQKNSLYGQAAAFLMPILWEEPFGIVMAEALACGTPIIGLRRGSVPEVVQQGETGFVCDSVEEMVDAVGRLDVLSRRKCREAAETRFSDTVIVDAYEALYRSLVAG